MTSTIDNLKRKGGRPFGDGEAPKRTATSKASIAYQFTSFDIVNSCFSEISAQAANVGICWQSVQKHISFNSRPLKNGIALTPKYNGKVFVIASEQAYKKHGQVVGYYPIITFKTQKHGGVTEVFNGLEAAQDYYNRLQGNSYLSGNNPIRTNWEAKRKAEQRAKLAEEEAAKEAAYKAKRLKDFADVFNTLPREIGDHAYLVKKFGHLAPQAAQSIELRRGRDYMGDFVAYRLYDESMSVCGYQRIYAEIPKGREDNKDIIGKAKGAFALVGDAKKIETRANIAEGLANAITYHLAKDEPCFVALFANNLKPVVDVVRKLYADSISKITMIADNDRKNLAINGNFGIYKAIQAINYGNDSKEDYLIIPPCDKAISWDFSDVLVSNDYNIQTVQSVIDDKDNRYYPSRDPIASRLNCIELMPSKQRQKGLNSLLACAVSLAPMRPIESSLNAIRARLGDDYSVLIDSLMDWVNKLYNEKKEAVKPLFSFTDKLPVFFAPSNINKLNAQRLLDVGGFYIDNRGTGEGKTLLMAEITRLAKKYKLSVGYIAHRVSLIANSAKRLDLENYQDLKPFDMPDVQGSAICANSLDKLYFSEFFEDCDVLFIDEIKQVLEHVLYGTVEKKARERVLNSIKRAIQNAKLVVTADADLDQETLDWLNSCRPVTHQIKNDLSGKPPKVDKTVFFDKYDIIQTSAIHSVLSGKKTLIQCDTKAETEVIAKLLTERGISADDILIINRDTKAEALEAEFLKDPNAYLAKYEPLVVLASPTISSGFSIELPGAFDAVYLLMTGILTPTEIMQTSARYRLAKELFIGFDNKNNRQDQTTEEQKLLGDMVIRGKITASFDNETDNLMLHAEPSELDKLRYKVMTKREKSRKDYANKTLLCFEAKGYTVKPFVNDESSTVSKVEEIKIFAKQARKAVKEERIFSILNADAISKETAKHHKKNANKTTRKQKRELARFEIVEGLAIVEPTAQDIEFIEDSGFKKLSRFEIMQSIEADCIEFDKYQAQTIGNLSLMTKATEQNSIYKMLFETLGINQQSGKGSFTHKQAVEALNNLQQKHGELAALGLGNFEQVKEKTAIRSIGYLLDKLGLETTSEKSEGKRHYSIKPDSWECMANYTKQRKAKDIHPLRISEAQIEHLETDRMMRQYQKCA